MRTVVVAIVVVAVYPIFVVNNDLGVVEGASSKSSKNHHHSSLKWKAFLRKYRSGRTHRSGFRPNTNTWDSFNPGAEIAAAAAPDRENAAIVDEESIATHDAFLADEWAKSASGAATYIASIDASKVPCHFIHKMAATNTQPAAWPSEPEIGPLQYLGDPDKQKANREAICSKNKGQPGKICNLDKTACDEYPFANSAQGGADSSVMCVPMHEYPNEGGSLSGIGKQPAGTIYKYKYTKVPWTNWKAAGDACIKSYQQDGSGVSGTTLNNMFILDGNAGGGTQSDIEDLVDKEFTTHVLA